MLTVLVAVLNIKMLKLIFLEKAAIGGSDDEN
jgi:hypothetical protein